MGFDYIEKESAKLVRRFGTNEPFEIARGLNINILFQNNFGKLKGMYMVIKRNRFIFLNADLPEETQKIVCAHELGHDRLHREISAKFLEFMLYRKETRIEYEANMFAASLLISDSDVLECISGGYDAPQTAMTLNTDINLLALKIDQMIRRGHSLARVEHRTDFLR